MKYMLIIFLLHNETSSMSKIPMTTRFACEEAKSVVEEVTQDTRGIYLVKAKCVMQ